jgi:hypothetical protein
MLRKRAELVNSKSKEVSKQGSGIEIPNTIELEIATLPENVKSKVKELLRDRNRAASKGYGWKVVAIDPLSKKSRKSFFARKSTPSSLPSWLIILRSREATKTKKEQATKSTLPNLYSNPWAFQRTGNGAAESPSANAAPPSPTSTGSSFTSFLNPTRRNYSSSHSGWQFARQRSYGASSMKRGPPMNADQLVNDLTSRFPPRPGVVERPVVMERLIERQPSLEPRVSDAYYYDGYPGSSTEPDSARDTGKHNDLERLMDQFLKTFVEDGEGDNE